jgi:hypothetical protein
VCSFSEAPKFSLLHYAVINLRINGIASSASTDEAVKIVRLLLQLGADPTIEAKHVEMNSFASDCLLHGYTPSQTLTAMRIQPPILTARNSGYCDELLTALQEAENRWKEKLIEPIPIPPSVFRTLSNLRLSKDVDYMTFQCKDNVDITAHPVILSASSSYFHRFFTSPWAVECPDRCWKTEQTSTVMNIILDFVYTGQVDIKLMADNCCSVYVAAAEFEFDDLKIVARHYLKDSLSLDNNEGHLALAYLHEDKELIEVRREYMIQHLTCDNIIQRLEFAHTHNDKLLTEACSAYVKSHSSEMLISSRFAVLPYENPELWKKMFNQLVTGEADWDHSACIKGDREEYK